MSNILDGGIVEAKGILGLLNKGKRRRLSW